MFELPSLYDHQNDLRINARSSLATHTRSIVCANPGFGKSRLAKHILASAVNKPVTGRQSGNYLFAVHRRGLVDNASNSFSETPELPHGIIMSGRDTSPGRQLQLGSIDTMVQWFYEDGKYRKNAPTYDLIAFDEVHAHFSTLMTFLKGHDKRREELGLNRAYVIGLSATPEAKGLADVFGEIVTGPSAQWMIANGYLSSYRYYAPKHRADTSGLTKKFTDKSAGDAMEQLSGIDVVKDWKEMGEGRQTVGFYHRLKHAREAQAMFIKAGVRCEYVDGATKDIDRQTMFTNLNNGAIDYICNVGVIERGTDIPRIGCIQMCVAIRSIVRWRQMIGRGSRVHPEVSDCIILDHGGNLERGMGLFEDEIEWTLDRSIKDAKDACERQTMECPSCHAVYRGGLCSACGYEPKPAERKAQGLDFDGEKLVEFTAPKKKQERSADSLMVEALYMAGRSGRTWRQACGIYFRLAEKYNGRKMRVPKEFTVAGQVYKATSRESIKSSYRVRDLYEFVK